MQTTASQTSRAVHLDVDGDPVEVLSGLRVSELSDRANIDDPAFATSPVCANLDALIAAMPSLGYSHVAVTAVQLYRQAAEIAWYEVTSR